MTWSKTNMMTRFNQQRSPSGGSARDGVGLRLTVIALLITLILPCELIFAQTETPEAPEVQHRRGKIWENLVSDGMLGSGGAWDFLTSAPLGMYPGFAGFTHPRGHEDNAINTFANANFHNFRSGSWILAKDLLIPGQPPGFAPTPAPYELFASGSQGNTHGIASEGPNPGQRDGIVLISNYMEDEEFDPLKAEEGTFLQFNTNTGVTVTRRSYVWSYPGYSDFIIYDYIFKNTGEIVSLLSAETVPNTDAFQQTLRDVYFAFHSAISVSTKDKINFYNDLSCVAAGAFGWQRPYYNFYHIEDEETLFFSTHYNGGKEPPPENCGFVKDNEAWKTRFGDELMSPAAFGWKMIHADATGQTPRASAKPDFYRIDNFKQNPSPPTDLEFFKTNEASPQEYYEFATTQTIRDQLGNPGNRFNIFTFTYGPYTLAPGDSVRFVLAEVAGVMDYHQVIAGDPEGHFPDSTIAAILRNAENARRAVEWGLGATVDGIPLAADAPEPPPAPQTDAVNASVGLETPAIAVTWDNVAEATTLVDGSGATFYDGAEDLDGYRIYRSRDFQYSSDTQDPVLRGAAWTLLRDIPRSEISQYWDEELQRYRFVDESVSFGFRYGYYVSAYRTTPGSWTSANGTVVTDLGELESGSHRRSAPTGAQAGPVASMDVYAVPNPYVYGDAARSFGQSDPYKIEFRNLPERAAIRIFTISGDLIRTINHGPDERGNLSGTAEWDQKSDSGLLVAPGLYVFNVDSQTEGLAGELNGKLMIIR